MRVGGFTVRGGNLVVTRVRLWSPVERLKDADDFLVVGAYVKRGEDDVLLAEWRQDQTPLPGDRMVTLTGRGQMNYPLEDEDVIFVEWTKEGSPADVSGVAVEVQASRVGEVGEPTAEEDPGHPASREITRPLFRGEELADDINLSGLPDMTIPFYLYESASGAGTGDMTKAVYDTDNDGKIDVAAMEAHPPAAHTHEGTSDIRSTGQPAGKVLESDGANGASWQTPASGVTDHGLLSGLGDDDHAQYHNNARGDARYALIAHTHPASDIVSGTLDGNRLPAISTTKRGGVPATGAPSGLYLKDDGTWASPGGGGVTDHGALTGLGDDDHPHYHNDARGDARYAQRSNNLSDLASASVARTNLGLGAMAVEADDPNDGSEYVRKNNAWAVASGGGVTDHGALTGLGDDDHPQYLDTARHGAIGGDPHGSRAAHEAAYNHPGYDAHLLDKFSNPHSVTAAMLGLYYSLEHSVREPEDFKWDGMLVGNMGGPIFGWIADPGPSPQVYAYQMPDIAAGMDDAIYTSFHLPAFFDPTRPMLLDVFFDDALGTGSGVGTWMFDVFVEYIVAGGPAVTGLRASATGGAGIAMPDLPATQQNFQIGLAVPYLGWVAITVAAMPVGLPGWTAPPGSTPAITGVNLLVPK